MKVVIQRVTRSSIIIDTKVFSEINCGLNVLVGIEDADTEEDIDWLVHKICNIRIFNDEEGVMNCSVKDINGSLLIISQFTLHAMTKKGNRPSYLHASKPPFAELMYNKFVERIASFSELNTKTGVFGANMLVLIENDGPVTIIIDSKNKI